jgi:hypothetical protein
MTWRIFIGECEAFYYLFIKFVLFSFDLIWYEFVFSNLLVWSVGYNAESYGRSGLPSAIVSAGRGRGNVPTFWNVSKFIFVSVLFKMVIILLFFLLNVNFSS